MRSILVIGFALSASLANAGAPPAIKPPTCAEPVRTLKNEIDVFRKSFKSPKALEMRLQEWLRAEQASSEDVADLNWIRAVNPWLLPSGFPAKNGFQRCAGHLAAVADTAEITEWTACVTAMFPEELPPEFETLKKCLGGK